MIAELERGGRWHGVYLALHGAMGVRGVARPEADIARRVREIVGRDAFIAGTFDPHGNEDAEFLRQADFANGSPAFRPLATTASTTVRSAMVAISTSARSCAITCCSTHVAEPERSEWSASTAGQASRATASLASSTPSAMGCTVAVFSSASRRRHAHVATSSAALRASAGLPLVIAWTVMPTSRTSANGKPKKTVM